MSAAPRRRYTFFIDEEQRQALGAIKVRDGIPEAEQIRRAIVLWIEARRVLKSGRPRATTRKRP